jgi:hypothetical protein
MKFKGSIARGVILAMALTLIPLTAVSAQKITPGLACKVLNQKVSYQNKSYTCQKIGNKLAWDQGVKLAAPASKSAVSGGTCTEVGASVKNARGYLECRDVANGKRKYFQLSNSIQPLPAQNSPVPYTTCRVPDFRTNIGTWDYATAYPIKRVPLAKKNLNILYLPFDFPDHPGNGNPADIYGQEFIKLKDWVKWYSNGKKVAEVTTVNKWIRSTKPSTEYAKHFWHTNNSMSIGVEMILKDAENIVDYSDIDVIQLVFPKDLKTFDEGSGGRYTIMTNKGEKSFSMYTTGFRSFTRPGGLWFGLLHELLHHTWGIQQHAPAYPDMLNVSTGAKGPGQSLLSWDAMTLDWADPDELWCTDLKTLTTSEVTLVPMEREQDGVRAAMINLAPSRTLILESHRKDKWGNYNPGTYGVTAYIVDTRFATDRSGEGSGKDDGKGTAFTRAANFIEFPLKHDMYRMEWSDYATGKSYGIIPRFSMNYFLYEGESFTFDGVTVKLIRSGDNDTIQIKKN